LEDDKSTQDHARSSQRRTPAHYARHLPTASPQRAFLEPLAEVERALLVVEVLHAPHPELGGLLLGLREHFCKTPRKIHRQKSRPAVRNNRAQTHAAPCGRATVSQSAPLDSGLCDPIPLYACHPTNKHLKPPHFPSPDRARLKRCTDNAGYALCQCVGDRPPIAL
jgi:hypothetical protein